MNCTFANDEGLICECWRKATPGSYKIASINFRRHSAGYKAHIATRLRSLAGEPYSTPLCRYYNGKIYA